MKPCDHCMSEKDCYICNGDFEKAKKRIRELEAALRLVEFGSCDGCGYLGDHGYCVWCSWRANGEGRMDPDPGSGAHLPECPIRKALNPPLKGDQ